MLIKNFLLKIILLTLCFSMSSWALVKRPTAVFQVEESQIVLNKTTVKAAALIKPVKKHGAYGIDLTLKPNAAGKLHQVTKENVGKKFNILVNGKTILSATIQSPLDDSLTISGFTKKNANEFIDNLHLKK